MHEDDRRLRVTRRGRRLLEARPSRLGCEPRESQLVGVVEDGSAANGDCMRAVTRMACRPEVSLTRPVAFVRPEDVGDEAQRATLERRRGRHFPAVHEHGGMAARVEEKWPHAPIGLHLELVLAIGRDRDRARPR